MGDLPGLAFLWPTGALLWKKIQNFLQPGHLCFFSVLQGGAWRALAVCRVISQGPPLHFPPAPSFQQLGLVKEAFTKSGLFNECQKNSGQC